MLEGKGCSAGVQSSSAWQAAAAPAPAPPRARQGMGGTGSVGCKSQRCQMGRSWCDGEVGGEAAGGQCSTRCAVGTDVQWEQRGQAGPVPDCRHSQEKKRNSRKKMWCCPSEAIADGSTSNHTVNRPRALAMVALGHPSRTAGTASPGDAKRMLPKGSQVIKHPQKPPDATQTCKKDVKNALWPLFQPQP